MSETLYKLEPHRTMHLGGFSDFGASAALHSTSATGFTVSGVFRDSADFAVLYLFDSDNFFEHPRLKYLPDFDFSGMVLSFNLHTSGVQPIDNPIFPTIDWPYMDVLREDGSKAQVKLLDYATVASGAWTPAAGTFHFTGPAPHNGDTVTLWYQNEAFTFTVGTATQPPGTVTSCQYNFFAGGAGTAHHIKIGAITYTHTEGAGEGSADVANALVALIHGIDLNADAAIGTLAYSVKLTPIPTNVSIAVSASDGNANATLCQPGAATPSDCASNLAAQINAVNWPSVSFLGLSAAATGATLVVTCLEPGYWGNAITMYSITTGGSITCEATVAFAGGSSDVTWLVSIDFTSILLTVPGHTAGDQIRQMWLTFAPQTPIGAAYASTTWDVTVTNWAVSDPSSHRALKVAGSGSVRIEDTDSWVSYSGSGWTADSTTAFWSQGWARKTQHAGDSVTVDYWCGQTHDLWLGTSLFTDRGIVAVSLDGGSSSTLDCYLDTAPQPSVQSRRRLRTSVAAGHHQVKMTLQATSNSASTGTWFYFDFLEAVVASDVQDPAITFPGSAPAIDYDTDHGYRLSPQRLTWMMEKLGFQGPVNEYVGVFWWNQRARSGGLISSATVTVGGTWTAGDQAFITVSGQTIGKTVFAGEDKTVVAHHLVYFINETYSGIWAAIDTSGTDPVITIHGRSGAAAYQFALTVSVSSSAGTLTQAGVLNDGSLSTWIIDTAQTPALNYGAAAWHADLYAEVALRSGWKIVSSFSMELVHPPDATWPALFHDGTPVATDTGFSFLTSNHCHPGANLLALQKAAFLQIADLQAAAGLTPWVQAGEFLWWYFQEKRNVPIGYLSYTNPISVGSASPHGRTTGDVVQIAGVQGMTAANGTWAVTVTDSTHFTIPVGANAAWVTNTGTWSGGGMALYDAETTAAAVAFLGSGLPLYVGPDGDPSTNTPAANFLRNRLRDHVAAIAAYVKAAHSTALFEVLYPYDVNYPSPSGSYDIGGRLNFYINTPTEWMSSGNPLDTICIEALDRGASSRNLTLAIEAMKLPLGWGWDLAKVRYLFPIFNPGTPHLYEQQAAQALSIPSLTPFAMDHVCLFGWDLSIVLRPAVAVL